MVLVLMVFLSWERLGAPLLTADSWQTVGVLVANVKEITVFEWNK